MSFHNVHIYNASLGWRENAILTKTYLFGTEMWWEILVSMWGLEERGGIGRHPWGGHSRRCVCTPDEEAYVYR